MEAATPECQAGYEEWKSPEWAMRSAHNPMGMQGESTTLSIYTSYSLKMYTVVHIIYIIHYNSIYITPK
jgi:hypothetical protein